MTREDSPELTTPRCVLRPLGPADAEALHALWCAPGVRRFLWDDEIISMEATRAAIAQSQRMFEQQAFGLWGAWLVEEPSRLIGFSGLWPFRDPPELELLYGVAEPRWGCGHAPEIASAVLTYCFDALKMPVVRASTDLANSASVRVLEKLGFRFVRKSAEGPATVYYEREAPGPSS